MNIHFFISTILLLNVNALIAADDIVNLQLADVENLALKSSSGVKAIDAEVDAARNKAESHSSLFYPKITLEGTYKYLTEVPNLSFPGGAHTAFGDHHNYSIGPVLNWTVWDFGSIRKTVSGLDSQEQAKNAERHLTKKQVILSARLAYFKVQLRLEQKRLLSDSLKLSQTQYRDIQNRMKAGSSNRIDLLSASKEVLNLKIQFRQIQSDLASDLTDLYSLMGKGGASIPLTDIETESIAKSLATFSKYESKTIEEANFIQHPLVKMHTANMELFRLTAEGVSASRLPKLSLFAKTSLDYPNGPVLDPVNQNTVGLTLSMPLFEGSRSAHEASEKQSLSIASGHRIELARTDLNRDWKKAHAQLQGLREKVALYNEALAESEERARLVYDSYRVGRSNFLDVQAANLHALEAKVQATTNDFLMLNQLTFLASISEDISK